MATFWIEDLKAMSSILQTINERMGILEDDIEGSAKMRIDELSGVPSVFIEATKYSKDGKELNSLEIKFSLDYQGVDEVISVLDQMLGLGGGS